MGNKWAVDADGGHLANPDLSSKLRYFAQPMMKFGQFVRDEEDAIGKQKGDTWNFDKITEIVTPASQTGIAENATMPESKFQVIKSSGTITEYGNSVPYSGKLETLSEWDPSNIAQRVLLDDQSVTLDSCMASYFKAAKVVYTPLAADGHTFEFAAAPTTTYARALDINDVERIVDYLKQYKIKPYDGENWICIGSVKALRSIRQDSKWISAALYGDPDRLFHGEVGMYEKVRFIETNNDGALKDVGTYGEAVFFGEDPVVEGVAIAPEVRAKIPTDYGRSKGVAWYALMGWATAWRYTASTEEQFRIIWVVGDNSGFTLGPPSGY